MKSKLRLLAALFATAAFCGTASAQLDNFYAEGIVGSSSFKVSTGRFTNNTFITATPVTGGSANTITVTGKDESDSAYGLRIGYNLNDIFGVEASYINAGTAVVRGTAVYNANPASASAINWKVDMEEKKYTFNITARHGLGDKFVILGRLGIGTAEVQWGKTITTVTVPAAPNQAAGVVLDDAFQNQQRKVDFDYGIELMYKINDHIAVSGNYDHLTSNQSVDVISVGARYSF